VACAMVEDGAAVVVGFLQAPNQPGVPHVLVGCEECVVRVGAGAA